MELNELRKKLYSKKSEIEERPRDFDPLDPRSAEKKPDEFEKLRKKEWKKGGELTKSQRSYLLKIASGIGILLAFLAAGYAFYIYKLRAFSEKGIVLSFDVPESVETGEEFSFEFLYHNNNRVSLENCELRITHPETLELTKTNVDPDSAGADFIVFNLEKLDPNENGSISFNAKVAEKEKTITYLNATLIYKRKGAEETGTKEISQGIKILASKVVLVLEATRQASAGNIVEYLLKIKNNTGTNLNSVEARFHYPDGFNFSSSSIEPSDEAKSIFKLSTINPRDLEEIKVTGTLAGSASEMKRLSVEVGTDDGTKFTKLAEESAQTEVVGSPLLIEQVLSGGGLDENNSSVNPGASIRVKINYHNSSDLPLRDAIITAKLEGRAIDYENVSAGAGHFDLTNKQITWTAEGVPELAVLEPQEKGSVDFSIPTASHLPSDNLDDKHFQIASVTQIDSPDVPTPIGLNKIISSDRKEVKLNSKVFFEATGFYNDNVIPNEGPAPPRVGTETTYTIHWKLVNVNNDLSNVVIKTTLPNYVNWKDNYFPTNTQQLSYNSRTREVIWNLGKVPALTGTQLASKEAAFQVGVTPQENQVGQELILINQSKFQGTDNFTGVKYELDEAEINTGVKNDISVESGKVVE